MFSPAIRFFFPVAAALMAAFLAQAQPIYRWLDAQGKVVLPQGAIGFRWGPEGRADQGQWNLQPREARHGTEVTLRLSLLDADPIDHEGVKVAFPYFGGIETRHFTHNTQEDVLVRNVPVKTLQLKDGPCQVATVFDLLIANYGIAKWWLKIHAAGNTSASR
mgnify:CR=1 FL=1